MREESLDLIGVRQVKWTQDKAPRFERRRRHTFSLYSAHHVALGVRDDQG